jgi:hypothetical protein
MHLPGDANKYTIFLLSDPRAWMRTNNTLTEGLQKSLTEDDTFHIHVHTQYVRTHTQHVHKDASKPPPPALLSTRITYARMRIHVHLTFVNMYKRTCTCTCLVMPLYIRYSYYQTLGPEWGLTTHCLLVRKEQIKNFAVRLDHSHCKVCDIADIALPRY